MASVCVTRAVLTSRLCFIFCVAVLWTVFLYMPQSLLALQAVG